MEENTISQEDMIEKVQTSKNNYSVIYHKEISKTIKAMSESYIKSIFRIVDKIIMKKPLQIHFKISLGNTKKVERLY